MGKRPREADGLEGFEPDDLLDWLTEPGKGDSIPGGNSFAWLEDLSPANGGSGGAGRRANGSRNGTPSATLDPVASMPSLNGAHKLGRSALGDPMLGSAAAFMSVSDPKEMDDLIDSLPSHYPLTTTAADRMLHLNLLKQLRGDGPNATVLTSWIPSKDASGLHYLRLHAVFRDK